MEVHDMEVLAWRLFEESNDAIFLLHAETELIWQANPAAQRLTGMRWRQLRDRRLDELLCLGDIKIINRISMQRGIPDQAGLVRLGLINHLIAPNKNRNASAVRWRSKEGIESERERPALDWRKMIDSFTDRNQ